jgi:hypothetical protein
MNMANFRNKFLRPKIIATLVVLVLIGGYALSRSWNLLAGPLIVIDTPTSGETLKSGYVIMAGEAKRIATLTLNGRQIFTDASGNFRESLLLLPGYNIIVVEAKDKFGRRTVQKLALINQES